MSESDQGGLRGERRWMVICFCCAGAASWEEEEEEGWEVVVGWEVEEGGGEAGFLGEGFKGRVAGKGVLDWKRGDVSCEV